MVEGGLSCVKYLLFGFNLIFFVSRHFQLESYWLKERMFSSTGTCRSHCSIFFFKLHGITTENSFLSNSYVCIRSN